MTLPHLSPIPQKQKGFTFFTESLSRSWTSFRVIYRDRVDKTLPEVLHPTVIKASMDLLISMHYRLGRHCYLQVDPFNNRVVFPLPSEEGVPDLTCVAYPLEGSHFVENPRSQIDKEESLARINSASEALGCNPEHVGILLRQSQGWEWIDVTAYDGSTGA